MKWEQSFSDLKRGEDLEAISEKNLEDINEALKEYWSKIIEATSKFGKKENEAKIIVGIWATSGRIITDLLDSERYCVIALTLTEFEAAYFELPEGEDENFMKEYKILFNSISKKLIETFDAKKFNELGKAKNGCIVIISNCADKETEEIIFKK